MVFHSRFDRIYGRLENKLRADKDNILSDICRDSYKAIEKRNILWFLTYTSYGKELNLKEHRKKRDLQKKTEPTGEVVLSKRRLYVIQKYAASHLHLEL